MADKQDEKLSDEMVRLLVNEYGPKEFLARLSDSFWFQAFECVLGFDWHSSGLTTVVAGVLKDVLQFDRHGVEVAGGKGEASRKTPKEVAEMGILINLSTKRIEELQYASRICAKVDTVAIQAGYPLYHHNLFLTENGDWCIVQQGICAEDRTARRYHWLSSNVQNFIIEPHDAIVGDAVRPRVLNMTAKEAEENRRTCADLVKESPNHIISSIKRLSAEATLDYWIDGSGIGQNYQAYSMPRRLNWDLFAALYEYQPVDYEALVAFPGVGPAVARSLSLVAELVYGAPASWKDPVKFSFAHGGKDGVPFPVDKETMDYTIKMLGEILKNSSIEDEEKKRALKRLAQYSALS